MARISTRRAGRHTATVATDPTATGRHRAATTGRPALLRRLAPLRLRRFAPLGAGFVVLALLGLIAAVLPRSTDEAPVVRGTQVLADPQAVPDQDTPLALPAPVPPTASAPPAPASPPPSPATTTKKATPRKSADGPAAGTDRPVAFGVRPLKRACSGNAGAPKAGDVICYSGSMSSPLKIRTGGTPGKPIVYSGDGKTRVPGITVEADNVVLQGFVSSGAESTGIYAAGRNVTIQDNTITQVRHAGDDVDAIRFFGDGAKVLHNSVRDLEAGSVGDSHVDCIQTYATSRPGSSNVVIQGNRCEGIRAQCLMAEGPNAETATGKGGGGQGVSRNWLFDRNFCDSHAEAQSVALQDIQNVTMSNNTMAGAGNKAFALGQNSTGAVIKGNTIGGGYKREVGFDDDSARGGYQGPDDER